MAVGWGVVMTQPNAERKAVFNLARQGFECYVPKFHEGKRSGVLFSRYVFVNIIDAWHSIFGTFGVTSLIRNGDKPATVKSAFIDELKAREGSDGFIDLTKEIQIRKPGDKVSVVGGPFYGFTGIYQGQSAHEREIVLLNMLGRSVRVELESKLVA